jgi:hypothetical protein
VVFLFGAKSFHFITKYLCLSLYCFTYLVACLVVVNFRVFIIFHKGKGKSQAGAGVKPREKWEEKKEKGGERGGRVYLKESDVCVLRRVMYVWLRNNGRR